MKKNLIQLLFSIPLILSAQAVYAAPNLVDPWTMVKRLGVGINAVCRGTSSGGDPVWQKRFATDIANAGFDTVRLWAKPSAKDTGGPPNYIVKASYWANIEAQIDDSLNAGLNVILVVDEKWYSGSYNQYNKPSNTAAQKKAILDRIVKFWAQASKRWKNKSENLVYQILNEPAATHGLSWSMPSNAVYMKLLKDSVKAIRANDKNRNITFFARNHWNISQIRPKDIPGLGAYYFGSQHGYPGKDFHSRGKALWGPSNSQVTEMNQYFNKISTFVNDKSRHSDGKRHPVAITEFGTRHKAKFGGPSTWVYKNGRIEEKERAQYTDYIVKRARKNDIAILLHSGPAAGNGFNFSIYRHTNAVGKRWTYPRIVDSITKYSSSSSASPSTSSNSHLEIFSGALPSLSFGGFAMLALSEFGVIEG
ncbi:cellulase family glycosylhydrolase [Acaryochloris sp. IP29b_bin.137]|uniref:glycoside hydrolase family 5 protein n=1 Tax=Acaryochloris sp. IP29b_bin.137 TaxID=2969217 RepID=UPI0026126ED9|nr:cellulase family glycosylhydrolase [Acaryochloris sp. IP29b_bin.137]